jgi:HEAT repeat protein
MRERWSLKVAASWLSCGLSLLLVSMGIPSSTLADEPAPTAEPLVIEFEYSAASFKYLNRIRQEIVVAEGTTFEVLTHAHGDHFRASGRIGRVHDEQVELEMSFHSGEWQSQVGTARRQLHYENLPVGRFQSFGYVHGGDYLRFLWVRRGVDPVPELVASLRRLDKDSLRVPWYVAKLHGDAGALIPELVRVAEGHAEYRRQASTLKDAAWQRFRRGCTVALGKSGQDSPAAVRVLQTLLKGDDDDGLRIAAAVSLWQIAKHQDALTFLVGRLSAPDEDIRCAALIASADGIRRTALIALAEIGAEASSVGPSIVPLLNASNKSTRDAAAWALWRTTRDPRAVDTLIAALKDGDMSAGGKLGLIGYPAARRAAPLLAGMVFREYPYHVAKALRRVDPDARQCLPLIVQAFSRNEGRGAEGAGKVLASYGPTLLPALRDLLQEGDEHARRLAFSSLWHSAPDPAAVETLVDALQHADPQVRRAAASYLGNMEPGGMGADLRPAIPALVKVLNDDVETVREAAAVALEEIGAPAVRAVQHELKQGNKRTRQRAEEILKTIKEYAEMD